MSNQDTDCSQTWLLLEGVINDIVQFEKLDNVGGVRKNYVEKYRIDKQKRSQIQIAHSQTQTDPDLAEHDVQDSIDASSET